ncbi:hypothetical protein MMC24_004570 [Lignoscripta atroalba]|nr:hypothetical protein [Lignoscripta atroalba]
MQDSKKRKAENGKDNDTNKKLKGPKQWRVPKKSKADATYAAAPNIEPGDSGIWATCEMHREGKCTGELRDLFNEYAERLYPRLMNDQDAGEKDEDDGKVDIEADISKEIEGMRHPTGKPLFQPVRIDIRCGTSVNDAEADLVLFFKTRAPVEPVSFVHRICTDAAGSVGSKKNRWVKRLSPMTLMGKATEKGLEEVTKRVLAPHFHQEGNPARKFAIRTTIRNHTTLTRDVVIKQVADAVGKPHTVDLHGYDLLIVVEIYQSICGMSVVGSDFDTLKRYNLAEIYDPRPKAEGL